MRFRGFTAILKEAFLAPCKIIDIRSTTEAETLSALLNACQNATLESLNLGGALGIGVEFLRRIAEFASGFTVRRVYLNDRRLAKDLPNGALLETVIALNGVCALYHVPATQWKHENLTISQYCSKNGIGLLLSGDALLEDDDVLRLLFDDHDGWLDVVLDSTKCSSNLFKRFVQVRQLLSPIKSRHIFTRRKFVSNT